MYLQPLNSSHVSFSSSFPPPESDRCRTLMFFCQQNPKKAKPNGSHVTIFPLISRFFSEFPPPPEWTLPYLLFSYLIRAALFGPIVTTIDFPTPFITPFFLVYAPTQLATRAVPSLLSNSHLLTPLHLSAPEHYPSSFYGNFFRFFPLGF